MMTPLTATALHDPVPISATPRAGDTGEPIFDADVLGDMFNNDPFVIAALLRTFVASTQASLSGIDAALAAQDLATVSLLAHKIKGGSRMSGALALGRCAQDLEWAAKAGGMAVVEDAVARLTQHWRAAQATINALG